MNALKDLLTRFGRTVTTYAGDETLMQAGISAAANVIVADGEVAGEEFETTLVGLRANPIIEKGYDLLMLEEALYEAIAWGRTRAGRVENLRRVAAIAGRPIEQRQDAFLVAADVTDHEGVSEIEDKALAEIAAALIVNKSELMQTAIARTSPILPA